MAAVVYNKSNGEAYSYANSVDDLASPEEMHDGLAWVEVAELPVTGETRWDPATLSIVELTAEEKAQFNTGDNT